MPARTIGPTARLRPLRHRYGSSTMDMVRRLPGARQRDGEADEQENRTSCTNQKHHLATWPRRGYAVRMKAERQAGAPGPMSAADEAATFKRRLERLVVDLLGFRFKTANDLWQLQLRLLALQRDIQASITRRKAGPKSGKNEDLDALREARWHARRFGDAFAWILFRGERRLIYPLAQNERVPILPDGHSARGMTAIAAELSTLGYGFPFLHDIAEMLRVGDLTLFWGEERPRTVEVKTELVSSEARQGSMTYTYNVVAVWPADQPTPASSLASGESQRPQPALNSGRFRRQLSRMTKARVIGTAELGGDGRLVNVDGTPTLLVQATDTAAPSHWPLLRKLVQQAKRTGFATGVAEQEVVYAALYRKDGFDPSTAIASADRLPAVLVKSGILFDEALRDRNYLIVSMLPDRRGNGPHLYLPYYLYPLPRSAVLDLLHARLLLFSLLNLGRVAAALEKAGFRVEMPKTDSEYRRSPLRIFTEVEVGPRRLRVELGGLHIPITEMIMEASSSSSIVQWALAAAKAAAAQAPEVIDGRHQSRPRARQVIHRGRWPRREPDEEPSAIERDLSDAP